MKVLTSPSSMGQVGSEPFDLLRKNGFEIINNPFGRKLTEEEVIDLAKDCVGIVAGVEPLNKQVMDALPELRCISRVGVGMDSVDLEYAKKKNIIVLNTPDGPTRAVAELTLGMTLSLLRKIPQADHAMKSKIWKKQTGNLLQGKEIGVIGLGRIGKMVASMFRALGNSINGYDLYPDEQWATEHGIRLHSFDELLKISDIITLHVPPSEGNRALISKNEFKNVKSTALLINISRGGVVNEDDLYDVLVENRIGGAAIDVFKEEPYIGKLCDLENVILTPHLGSYAAEGKLQMEIDAVNNIINVLKTIREK